MIGDRVIIAVSGRLWPGTVTAIGGPGGVAEPNHDAPVDLDTRAGQVRVLADCGVHTWRALREIYSAPMALASLMEAIRKAGGASQATQHVNQWVTDLVMIRNEQRS